MIQRGRCELMAALWEVRPSKYVGWKIGARTLRNTRRISYSRSSSRVTGLSLQVAFLHSAAGQCMSFFFELCTPQLFPAEPVCIHATPKVAGKKVRFVELIWVLAW